MLKEDIRKAFNEARKAGDAITKAALESVIANVLQKEKTEVGKVLTDAETVECVSKEIKVQREIRDMYEKLDAAKKKEAEDKIAALERFLPKQLTEEEVLGMIAKLDVYPDASPKTKGMIIKALMPMLAGVFDKSKVNGLVEKHLAQKE